MIKRHLHWFLIGGGVAVLSTAFVISDQAEATRAPASLVQTLEDELQEAPLNLPTRVATEDAPLETSLPDNVGEWIDMKVKSGDSLSLLFTRHGLSNQDVYSVTREKAAAKRLKKVFPGDLLRARVYEGTLIELVYGYALGKSLHLTREGEDFEAEIVEIPLEHRTGQATGIINDSLFLSAQQAGLTDNLTMELAGIFGWDIDFSLDIRQGDSFAVIYEELFLNGEKVRDGNIIAATFTNDGKTYQAIRYTDASDNTDYYAPDGRSMRKAFLRSPVSFSRISSRFNLRRKHPVLNKIRAHKGVDYAAARGTPIRATGDGKIVHKGKKGGYGRTIIIQHGTKYSTLYAHMSSYARGMHAGKRIRQGQVIGYVGSSGLATGPHLHYEFRVNGAHRNPLTIKLPDAQPLPSQYMADFQRRAMQLGVSLDLLHRTTRLASTTPSSPSL